MGCTASAIVEARADAVWRVLSDVARWPEWSPTMTWVQPLGEWSELTPGTRTRIKQPGLPVNLWVVRTIEPGRSFTWTTGNPLFTVHGHHAVDLVDAGRTLVTLRIAESGPLAALVDRFFRRTNRRNLEAELRGLRLICERDSDAEHA